MMTAKLSDDDREHAAQIVAQFATLIHAWKVNDFHEAARTRDALWRLGVKVQLPRQAAQKGGASE